MSRMTPERKRELKDAARRPLQPLINRMAQDEIFEGEFRDAGTQSRAMDLCRSRMSRDDYEELCDLMGWREGGQDEPSEREEMAERIKAEEARGRRQVRGEGEDEPSEREEMARRIRQEERRLRGRENDDDEAEDEPSEREEMAERIRETERKLRGQASDDPDFLGAPLTGGRGYQGGSLGGRYGGAGDRKLAMDKARLKMRDEQRTLARFPEMRRIKVL
jgi:hypothetical protein